MDGVRRLKQIIEALECKDLVTQQMIEDGLIDLFDEEDFEEVLLAILDYYFTISNNEEE
ncbi:MAG: hypothetical protein CH6_0241 [Candidatus Kapaibacterium sp.]|nr:MAG: hypothetical protein CH6_0241 [Candidatus Kapabacteria bacterium]